MMLRQQLQLTISTTKINISLLIFKSNHHHGHRYRHYYYQRRINDLSFSSSLIKRRRYHNNTKLTTTKTKITTNSTTNNNHYNNNYNHHHHHHDHNNHNNTTNNNFFLILSSRIITTFSILHFITEYCFEMTKCEGPSMMPTIQPNGEIILIEKITHCIYGFENNHSNSNNDNHNNNHSNDNNSNNDDAQYRIKRNRQNQIKWEKEESKLWLAGKHRDSQKEQEEEQKSRSINQDKKSSSLSSSTTTSSTSSTVINYKKRQQEELTSTHTWYEPKLKEANELNYQELSSWKKCYQKMTSGLCVGDVVVVKHPDRDGTVCKRILGLPGDLILRPKHTTTSFSSRAFHGRSSVEKHKVVMDLFQYNSSSSRSSGSDSDVISLNETSLIVVPSGHIWVEGDNSMNSSDSRNYGPIPASLVVGKVR